MKSVIDISVIIPHRDTPKLLNRLLDSIPLFPNLEVIVVDNSVVPLEKNELSREAVILYSDVNGGAGRARNMGIDGAGGRWLLFADADDYFVKGAFDVLLDCILSTSDIIYFGMDSINESTGEGADRGFPYTSLVRDYLVDNKNELNLRLRFDSPCCKLISLPFVKLHGLRYDECVAGNDVYFSISCGYLANSIHAVDFLLYVATESPKSLTKRVDCEALKSRLLVRLKMNSFYKKVGLPEFQQSIAYYLYKSLSFGPFRFVEFLYYVLKANQNPFVGFRNWPATFKKRS
jgi:glycosyltransferase involved in cell wall biosynthesis